MREEEDIRARHRAEKARFNDIKRRDRAEREAREEGLSNQFWRGEGLTWGIGQIFSGGWLRWIYVILIFLKYSVVLGVDYGHV